MHHNTISSSNTWGSEPSQVIVDYFAMSIQGPYCEHAEKVKTLLGGKRKWRQVPPDRKGLSYKRAEALGSARLYSDGYDEGLYLVLTGEACRELERDLGFKQLDDWRGFLGQLLIFGKAKRLDMAYDDFSGLLDIEVMLRKAENGEVAGRIRTGRKMADFSLKTSENTSRSIRFGGSQSEIQLMIYDKAAQLKQKKRPCEHATWVRVELRMRKKHAVSGVEAFIASGEEVIRSNLVKRFWFTDDQETTRRSRKKRWQPWVTFFWNPQRRLDLRGEGS